MSDKRVCGTGTWISHPKPGDPDNNSITISATGAMGSINVRWTYPAINNHAVAFFTLYRSDTGRRSDAVEIAQISGNFYYDTEASDARQFYSYWVSAKSVNGTVGDWVGPAHARPFDMIEHLLQDMTGRIDAGKLAQNLRTEIDRIHYNKLGIDAEMIARAASDDALGVALNEIRGDLDGNMALIQQESLARVTADEALAHTVNTLYSDFNGVVAAVQEESYARASADQALAKQINTTQSVLGENIASVQTFSETNIKRVDGVIEEIGALWTARVQANGLIGGFGVYNDGRTVQAGFDVDEFWIGRTNNAKIKPFIYSGNQFYFNGKVNFSNIAGPKPDVNADKTSSNTAYDTARVAGTTASTVRDRANAGNTAATRVNNWVRPNSTLIDGNKIYTGDAYVDTLQIKGSAITSNERITLATGRVSGNQWFTLGTRRVSHPGTLGSGVLIIVNIVARSTGNNSDPHVHVYRNGGHVGAKHSVIGYAVSIVFVFFDPYPGSDPNYTIRLEATDGGGQRDGTIVLNGDAVFMACKR